MGGSTTATGEHAFLWSEETGMLDLGTLGGVDSESSEAVDVNNLGQVIGWSEGASGDCGAFVWTEESGMIELGVPSGGSWCWIYKINDLGQAIGSYQTETTEIHAVLWTIELAEPTPEEQIIAIEEDVTSLVDGGILTAAEGQSLIDSAESLKSDLCG